MKVNGDRPRLGGGAGIERIYFLICNEVDSQNDDPVKARIWSDQIRS